MDNPIVALLKEKRPEDIDPAMLAYVSNLTSVAQVAPEISRAIVKELQDQRHNLKLIASENYCSLATQLAMSNVLTDKYAEGVPGARFYEGCNNIDDVEAYACEQAKALFGAEHAYVQPHSGADANMVAFWGILQQRVQVPELEKMGVKNPAKLSDADWETVRAALGNQRLLGMDLAAGGHLTHGYRLNVSGRMFHSYSYGVSQKDYRLDYDAIEKQVDEIKPLILLGGYSAYPRKVDFRRMREIADKVGAVLMVDMAHFAGLVAGGVFTGDYNPVEHAHVVTSTTHKTLRGPRGGIVLCTEEFADVMDKGCPMVLGGPLAHVMAAKGVAFTEARTQAYKDYAHQIVANASAFADACAKKGMTIVGGGTDNHLFLIDAMKSYGLSGRQAAAALKDCRITLNKNGIPFDPESPMITSGLRIGASAVTTLGMGPAQMETMAEIIDTVLRHTRQGVVESGQNAGKPSKIKYELDTDARTEAVLGVETLLREYPVYPELDADFLEKHFAG
ncbi:MAG: glycine hydroxymethyltransferase [Verrucomicrobiota bacterium]